MTEPARLWIPLAAALCVGMSAAVGVWSASFDAYPRERTPALENRAMPPQCDMMVVDNVLMTPTEQASRLEKARLLGPCRGRSGPVRL